MGYRSQVAIAFTDHAVRLLNAITEHEPNLAEMVSTAELSTINESEDERGGKLFWDYVKWFDEYDDVLVMENLLQYLPDEDFHFLRLGEETNDIEERGCYYESDMYVSRTITW